MNIKNILFSVLIVSLLTLSMGFVGKSKSNLTVVTPGGSAGSACNQGTSQIVNCPSGTVIVGGACNFVQGQSAVDEFNPVFFPNQSVLCNYSCTDEGQDTEVEVQVSAVCATTN